MDYYSATITPAPVPHTATQSRSEHADLQHSLAEQTSQHLLLQHRVRRGEEEEVQFLRQQLTKQQDNFFQLHQQLVQSRGMLDDMTRTLQHQEQLFSKVLARLAIAEDSVLHKTSMVTDLQKELADSDIRHQAELERCSAELHDLKHSHILQHETVSKKIDEVVKHVRDKEEELETVVASIATHEAAMQAKDTLIASLEEKLQTSRSKLETQTTEIVGLRQKFSGLQRDAENGERQVFQLTANLQQCQKQLELHIQDTEAAESLRALHQRVVSDAKTKMSHLEIAVQEKSFQYSVLRSAKTELEAEVAKQKHANSFAEQRYQDAETRIAKMKSEMKQQHEKQWQSEVELTEKLTQSNAELLLCQKELQKKQEELAHVELHLEEAKSQVHTNEVQCTDLKNIVARQKQSTMERASEPHDVSQLPILRVHGHSSSCVGCERIKKSRHTQQNDLSSSSKKHLTSPSIGLSGGQSKKHVRLSTFPATISDQQKLWPPQQHHPQHGGSTQSQLVTGKRTSLHDHDRFIRHLPGIPESQLTKSMGPITDRQAELLSWASDNKKPPAAVTGMPQGPDDVRLNATGTHGPMFTRPSNRPVTVQKPVVGARFPKQPATLPPIEPLAQAHGKDDSIPKPNTIQQLSSHKPTPSVCLRTEKAKQQTVDEQEGRTPTDYGDAESMDSLRSDSLSSHGLERYSDDEEDEYFGVFNSVDETFSYSSFST